VTCKEKMHRHVALRITRTLGTMDARIWFVTPKGGLLQGVKLPNAKREGNMYFHEHIVSGIFHEVGRKTIPGQLMEHLAPRASCRIDDPWANEVYDVKVELIAHGVKTVRGNFEVASASFWSGAMPFRH